MQTTTTTRQRAIDCSSADHERAFANKLMEILEIPAFVLDTGCKVMIWNRACERLTGVASAEVLGTSDHWRSFHDEPQPSLADLVIQNRTDEIHNLYPRQVREPYSGINLCAESWCEMPRVGRRRYLAADASPILDDDGALVAVVQTLRDMDGRKNGADHARTAGHSRRPDRPGQPALLRRHPARRMGARDAPATALVAADGRRRQLQGLQRHQRPPRRRRMPQAQPAR